MINIKSAQIRDFRDVRVRRLQGNLSEMQNQVQNVLQQLEQLKHSNPDVSFEEVSQELSYSLQYIFKSEDLDRMSRESIL